MFQFNLTLLPFNSVDPALLETLMSGGYKSKPTGYSISYDQRKITLTFLECSIAALRVIVCDICRRKSGYALKTEKF